MIPAKGHDYQDGKCTVCGAEDPDYQPDQPTQPENPGVKTGDESYVVLWSAALLLGGAALVLLPRKSGADTEQKSNKRKKWRALRRTPFFAGRLSGGVEIRERV